MLRLYRRLHALLSAERRCAPRTGGGRGLRRAPGRRHQMPDSVVGGTILNWVSVIDQVRADMTSAMKSAQRDRAAALRLVLSELQKAAKEGGDELAVLRRERKRRLE